MCDAVARSECTCCVPIGSLAIAMAKKERNQLFMFRLQQAPLFLIFTVAVRRICQADHWEKPFENLLVLHQVLFASVIRRF